MYSISFHTITFDVDLDLEDNEKDGFTRDLIQYMSKSEIQKIDFSSPRTRGTRFFDDIFLLSNFFDKSFCCQALDS